MKRPSKAIFAFATATILAATCLPTFAQQQLPVGIRATEGVRYIPLEAGKPGVLRTLDITVTNVTQRHLDLQVEYAFFALDAKNNLMPMPLREVANVKNKVGMTLSPGESKSFRAESFHMGELGASINKAKDLGVAVDNASWRNFYDQYYNAYRYYNNNYYGNNVIHTPFGAIYSTGPSQAPMTDAATMSPSGRLGANKDTRTAPMAERYYGYSILVYAGNEPVAALDKNPSNYRNFGVVNVKDLPPKK
jgi:ribosomal protein L13E